MKINTLAKIHFSSLKRIGKYKVPDLPSFKINPEAITNPDFGELSNDHERKMDLDRFKQSMGMMPDKALKEPACRYYAVEHRNRVYHVFNAYYYPMGRMITKICTSIRGKASPLYKNHQVDIKNGDICVVVNASDPLFTGKKLLFKNLKYHSGFVGHLKTHSYREILNRKPELLYYYLLRKFMPKNKVSGKYLENLKIYRGPTHDIPHLPQFASKPKVFDPLADINLREYVKTLPTDEIKLVSESYENQAKEFFGAEIKPFHEQKRLNDELETDEKLESDPKKKKVPVMSEKERKKAVNHQKKMIERYREVRAPYKKKKRQVEGIEFFNREEKAKKSPHYKDLADQEDEDGEEMSFPDPLKRIGFDKEKE